MDDFTRLPSEQRRAYFEEAAERLDLNAQIIEKDFWVCWSLKRLFSLAEFQDHLTFKGGTSLSKVYRVIERFSEDVDVAIERGFLGFGGDMEPERGTSRKEQQRRVDSLKAACQATITPSDQIVGELRQDYLGMRPMFFRTPPPFEEILSSLPEMEAKINNAAK